MLTIPDKRDAKFSSERDRFLEVRSKATERGRRARGGWPGLHVVRRGEGKRKGKEEEARIYPTSASGVTENGHPCGRSPDKSRDAPSTGIFSKAAWLVSVVGNWQAQVLSPSP